MTPDRRALHAGVLVSGSGTNLRALCAAAQEPGFPARIVRVVCNRRDAGAIAVAAEYGVTCDVLPLTDFSGDTVARDRAMAALLHDAGVELVVCAGYNRVLSDAFLDAFPDAILNLHPSLLPAFAGGMHAIEDALAAGVRITGCTVHLLEKGATDGGAIVLQAAVEVRDGDTPETLRGRIHEAEWRILPEAVRLFADGRLRREGRVIRILSATEVAG